MTLIKRNNPRKVKFTPNINPYADGSVLVEFGNTKVHVTATIEDSVPKFLKDSGTGWVTAEYAMLPTSTHSRIRRERKGISGRSQEIQRLIGRSLRAVVNFEKMGESSIIVDCDVLVADGGTRTAAISGGFLALSLAMKKLVDTKNLTENPIIEKLAAISVGISKEGEILADLNYAEDSSCETDLNLVMTESGKFVEIQGTAEGQAFSRDELDALLECGKTALEKVFEEQKKILQ